MKEEMLERMNVERSENFTDKVASIVFQYSELVNQGMDPEEALLTTADMMQNNQQPTQMVQPPDVVQQPPMLPNI
jgi:hypothetical protein